MKKFMVLYSAPVSAMEQMQNLSPEEQQKGMEVWMEWAAKCGTSLVDVGAPLFGGQKLTKSGSSPSKSNVAGYSILQADDIEGAITLLDGHPHLQWTDGAEIDVYECGTM